MALHHDDGRMTLVNLAKSETLSDRVATQILIALAERRQSQNALARAMGVPAMWVSDRVSGKTQITVNDLARIAETLGVSVGDLLPRDERRVTSPYLPASAIATPRNPLSPPIIHDGRTSRVMPRQPVDKGAHQASARRSRQLQPCG